MKKLSNYKPTHTLSTPNAQKSPQKIPISTTKLTKSSNRYINPSLVSIRPTTRLIQTPNNNNNNGLLHSRNIYNMTSPIPNSYMNILKTNIQSPINGSSSSKISYLKSKSSNPKYIIKGNKPDSSNELNEVTPVKENINLNYQEINNIINSDSHLMRLQTGIGNIQPKLAKLGNPIKNYSFCMEKHKLLSEPSCLNIPSSPNYGYSESLDNKSRNILLLNSNKSSCSPNDILKSKRVIKINSATKSDVNLPKAIDNTIRKTLSIGSNETLTSQYKDFSMNSIGSIYTHSSNTKNKCYLNTNNTNTQQSNVTNYSSGYDFNVLEGISYRISHGSSEIGNSNNNNHHQHHPSIIIEERCINHPYKKAKYIKAIFEEKEQVNKSKSSEKFCSKCAISLTSQGLKMKELIFSESALRKAEIEEFLINLATKKRDISNNIDSMHNKKTNIMIYYTKQAEKVDYLYDIINKFILQIKAKTLENINQNKDYILNEISQYQHISESILEEINRIQNDIENNIENIVKNIALEPFTDIMHRYKNKVLAFQTFIDDMKIKPLELIRLTKLNKNILDDLKPVILAGYDTVTITTSLLKRENITNDDYLNEEIKAKNDKDMNNCDKTSLCISFDNKQKFENEKNSSDQIDNINRKSMHFSSKSMPENPIIIMNNDKIQPDMIHQFGNLPKISQFEEQDIVKMAIIEENNDKNQQNNQYQNCNNKKDYIESMQTDSNLASLATHKQLDNSHRISMISNLESLLNDKKTQFKNFSTLSPIRHRSEGYIKKLFSFEEHDNNHQTDKFPNYSGNKPMREDISRLENKMNKSICSCKIKSNSVDKYIQCDDNFSKPNNEMINMNNKDINHKIANITIFEYINTQNKQRFLKILDKINANHKQKNLYYSNTIRNNKPFNSLPYIQLDDNDSLLNFNSKEKSPKSIKMFSRAEKDDFHDLKIQNNSLTDTKIEKLNTQKEIINSNNFFAIIGQKINYEQEMRKREK